MAREVYRFAVTIPAGTAQASPQVSALTMPGRVISRLLVIVPRGPRGLVGFRLTSGGEQMLPINKGSWVVVDGERLEYDLTDYITTGAWQLTAYNTGGFAHTLELEFHADLVPLPAELAGFQPLPNAILNG